MNKPEKKIVPIGNYGDTILENWEEWVEYCEELEENYENLAKYTKDFEKKGENVCL